MNGTAMSLKAARSKTVGGGWGWMAGGGADGGCERFWWWAGQTAALGRYLWLPLSGRQQVNASVSHSCDHLAGGRRL